jgi:hypothetical protein
MILSALCQPCFPFNIILTNVVHECLLFTQQCTNKNYIILSVLFCKYRIVGSLFFYLPQWQWLALHCWDYIKLLLLFVIQLCRLSRAMWNFDGTYCVIRNVCCVLSWAVFSTGRIMECDIRYLWQNVGRPADSFGYLHPNRSFTDAQRKLCDFRSVQINTGFTLEQAMKAEGE